MEVDSISENELSRLGLTFYLHKIESSLNRLSTDYNLMLRDLKMLGKEYLYYRRQYSDFTVKSRLTNDS